MYKLSTSYFGATPQSVIRLSDGACIPFDPDNTDYAEFLKKKAEGVKVYAADETIPDGE